jgi:hypothetical protein
MAEQVHNTASDGRYIPPLRARLGERGVKNAPASNSPLPVLGCHKLLTHDSEHKSLDDKLLAARLWLLGLPVHGASASRSRLDTERHLPRSVRLPVPVVTRAPSLPGSRPLFRQRSDFQKVENNVGNSPCSRSAVRGD